MSQVQSALPTYQPSGRLAPRTILAVILLGVPVALLCGWVYAQIIVTSKWIPLSLFIGAFVGTIIALCIAGVLKFSRSRSVAFNKYAAGTLALVVLWMRWLTTLLEYGLQEAATRYASSGPLGWFSSMSELVAHLKILEPGTSMLLLLGGWVLELLFLTSITSTLCSFSAEAPYSEAAGEAAKKDFEGELFWPGGQGASILGILQDRGATALLNLQRASELTAATVASQWWTLKITGKSVRQDPAARWLDLDLMEHTRDEEGKIRSKRTSLVAALCISDSDYAAFQTFFEGAASESEESAAGVAANSPHVNKPPADTPTPPELEPAVAALQAENYATVLALALPQCQHPDAAVRADAHRLCAMAHARQSQWEESFQHYHNLFELEPIAFNAMQLATTSVVCGQLLRGQAWFEKAGEINSQSSEFKPPQMRTHYISALEQAGELAAARPHLDWLADAYRLASTSDGHQLWCYGLPFFTVFLEKSLPILRACCSEDEIREWYAQIRKEVDDAGKKEIDLHLATLA